MALLPKRNPKKNPRIDELNWYDRYGKYPNERIVLDSSYTPYLICDSQWNKENPDKPEYFEDKVKYSWRKE